MSLRNRTSKTYPIRNLERKEPKVKESGSGRAVRYFCKHTTLHGFKYLISKNYYDRVGWLACCCASACCAGVLCSVLWARFLQVPALLTLQELRARLPQVPVPSVAVCPSPGSVASYFLNELSIPENITDRLPVLLSHVLLRKKTPIEHLAILEDILLRNNLSLPDALMKITPPCTSIVLNCRWQTQTVPCKARFRKKLTAWGACCVSRSHSMIDVKGVQLEVTRRLTIAMQCSDNFAFNGCQFYTKYVGEEQTQPMPLAPGYSYVAHVTFTSFEDSDPEKITEGTCVSARGYSRTRCLLQCREQQCACSEPLRPRTWQQNDTQPPPCSVRQLACLRDSNSGTNDSCNCLPVCKKVFTYIALESSPMNAFDYTLDEIYAGLNASTSTVLRLVVRISESRLFVVNSTETWITLLSSLGGVFNMFLGVGLFSALEVLFLVFVRLPIAIRSSSDMAHSDM